MRRLNKEQYDVYRYIATYIQQHGYSPVQSDIARALTLDPSYVKRTLWHLRDAGYITYIGAGSRMIYLTPQIPAQVTGEDASKKEKPRRRRSHQSQPRPFSPNRQRIYNFIKQYVAEYHFPPALRDIAQGLGIGATTVKYYVDMLRDQGYLTYLPGRSRSICLTQKPLSPADQRADTTTQVQA